PGAAARSLRRGFPCRRRPVGRSASCPANRPRSWCRLTRRRLTRRRCRGRRGRSSTAGRPTASPCRAWSSPSCRRLRTPPRRTARVARRARSGCGSLAYQRRPNAVDLWSSRSWRIRSLDDLLAQRGVFARELAAEVLERLAAPLVGDAALLGQVVDLGPLQPGLVELLLEVGVELGLVGADHLVVVALRNRHGDRRVGDLLSGAVLDVAEPDLGGHRVLDDAVGVESEVPVLGLGLEPVELSGLRLGLGEGARRGLERVRLPVRGVPVLGELELPLTGELGPAAVLDRAARLPRVDRRLARGLGRRCAALL